MIQFNLLKNPKQIVTTPEASKRTFEPNDFPVETILFNLIAPEKASNTFTDVVAFQTIIGTGWILGGKAFNPNLHDGDTFISLSFLDQILTADFL